MAGIPLSSQINLSAQLPLEPRSVAVSITERNGILNIQRYDGLICFVQDEGITYQLQGGTDNVNWVIYGGSEGSSLLAKSETFEVDQQIVDDGYIDIEFIPNIINEHIFVILNGLILEEGPSNDFIINGQRISFITIEVEDKITIKYKT